MSFTNRSRVMLALTPLLVVVWLLEALFYGVKDGLVAAARTFCWMVIANTGTWYRWIYRPAVYGHVADVFVEVNSVQDERVKWSVVGPSGSSAGEFDEIEGLPRDEQDELHGERLQNELRKHLDRRA